MKPPTQRYQRSLARHPRITDIASYGDIASYLNISRRQLQRIRETSKMKLNPISMKNSFSISILVALTLSSCEEDNSLFNEPMPMRAYETDAQIMAQFVEVDMTSDSNKKISGINLIGDGNATISISQ